MVRTSPLKSPVSICLWICTAAAPRAQQEDAQQILESSGVKGGLLVHLGCGDGRLTAAMRANESFLVHGLDKDPAKVEEARQHIRSLGLCGKVSVERWSGRQLPYSDNLVNLIVAEDPAAVSTAEMMRVLCPGGVACLKKDSVWAKTTKPWPGDIDVWTHWLHDSGNNAVAHDTRVGPPRRMQWVAEPLWSRGHEVPSSVGGVVTAGGRIVYALDEGQTGIYTLPSRWTLVARDAFNGVLLWKRPIPHWGPALSFGGFGNGFRPRRLVTDGERVFLPMGEDGVLTSLDARTGKLLGTLKEACGTREILCGEGMVVAVSTPQAAADAKKRKAGASRPALIAARPESLEAVWRAPAAGIVNQTVALKGGRVFLKARDDVIALDAKTGKEAWRTPFQDPPQKGQRRTSRATLMAHDGMVFVQSGSRLAAMSAENGKVVWERGDAPSSKGELFAAGGLLWRPRGSNIVGHDPATGEVRKTTDASPVFSKGHHPRCYPSKATERYVITNNRGAEFISLTGERHHQNDWLRGNCGHGILPANGLLYAPPNQCFCYGGVMLTGFKALGPGPVPAPPADPARDASRLERGPAYGDIGAASPEGGGDGDWPMYRSNAARLASTPSTLPADPAPAWHAHVGGRLTQPVVAGKLLLVADTDAYRVHAFDAKDGQPLWTFTAGGRIDSPPTIHNGMVLFGSADGWAYCLRASDGKLAWRFRAAPEDRRVGAFGRIESAWPVHGSVLVLDGIAYLTAGRSTHLDGGIHAYGLDPRSGRVMCYARLEDAASSPDEGEQGDKGSFVPAFHVEGARSDILSSDGTFIYMGPLKLDARLASQPTPYIDPGADKTTGLDLAEAPYVDTDIFKAGFEKRRGTDFPSLGVLRGPMGDKTMGLRMFSTGGFLDDSGYNRIYWMYSAIWPGYYIAHLSAKAGQMIAADHATTYAVQYFPSRTIHSPTFKPATKGYLLYADEIGNEPVLDHRARGRDKGMGYTRGAPPKWFQWVPVRIRAMVLAGGTLFAAGPPDVADESDPYAAFEGRTGAVLWSVSSEDGRKLGERKLEAPPVFDGMIAAGGRLYISTTDGKLLCFGPRKE